MKRKEKQPWPRDSNPVKAKNRKAKVKEEKVRKRKKEKKKRNNFQISKPFYEMPPQGGIFYFIMRFFSKTLHPSGNFF